MILDANVLLYAVDSESRFHDEARATLEGALNGPTRVGFPWISLMAFQRIATHPRVTSNPLDATTAWGFVSDWLSASQAWIPNPGPRHSEVFGRLLIEGDLRGNLVTDAHLAALAIEHGVSLVSFDTDFARFSGLSWILPGKN